MVGKKSGKETTKITPARRPGDGPNGGRKHSEKGVKPSSDTAKDLRATSLKGADSKLTPQDIEQFREILLAKRQELVGDVDNMKDDALRQSRSDASGDLSSMPIHMADIGSDNYEQEFTLNLIKNEQGLLKEIDEALDRIDQGTFGICLATGKPIGKARLKLKPWAKYGIDYVRKVENGKEK